MIILDDFFCAHIPIIIKVEKTIASIKAGCIERKADVRNGEAFTINNP